MNRRNRQISLTEEDLHFVVENAVKSVLMENGQDEGFFGGLGALGSKFGNRMQTQAQKMGNAMGGAYNNAKQAVSGAYNNAKQAVGNAVGNATQAVQGAYNNAKNTYQVGSINQDAQKAITNAVQALNQLKAADDRMTSMGQYSIIGRQRGLIDNLIQTLQGGGARSISGRFNNRRSAWTK